MCRYQSDKNFILIMNSSLCAESQIRGYGIFIPTFFLKFQVRWFNDKMCIPAFDTFKMYNRFIITKLYR